MATNSSEMINQHDSFSYFFNNPTITLPLFEASDSSYPGPSSANIEYKNEEHVKYFGNASVPPYARTFFKQAGSSQNFWATPRSVGSSFMKPNPKAGWKESLELAKTNPRCSDFENFTSVNQEFSSYIPQQKTIRDQSDLDEFFGNQNYQFHDGRVYENIAGLKFPEFFNLLPSATEQNEFFGISFGPADSGLDHLLPYPDHENINKLTYSPKIKLLSDDDLVYLKQQQPSVSEDASSPVLLSESDPLPKTASDKTQGQRDRTKDQLLLDYKSQGMTYKQIKVQGGFSEAESTLRGRYRTLTKSKNQRLRKPKWNKTDIQHLQAVVSQYLTKNAGVLGSAITNLPLDSPKHYVNKISWKIIADNMVQQGCYRYGNATVKRKYKDILEQHSRGQT